MADVMWRREKERTRRDEAVLLRGFYLRLLARWYLIPLAVLAGALIGGAVYYCAHVVFAPAREYAAGARLYLEFSPDAAGNARDYYNAWTWKELITADDILNTAMGELIDEGVADARERTSGGLSGDGTAVKKQDDELVLVPGAAQESGKLTRAEVLEAVTIRLPSDLRVMMLTATHRDPAVADRILSAMTDALVSFGRENGNFSEICVLEMTPALLVVTTDRTRTAVLWGAVLGLLVCLFCLFLYGALDDALYDPEMCARRFDAPMLGALLKKDTADTQAAEEEFSGQLRRELRAACEARLSAARRAAVLAAGKKGESARACAALAEALGAHFLDGACALVPLADASAIAGGGFEAAIVAVPYGKRNSAYADHLFAALSAQDIPAAGVVLYDADGRYLKRLYGDGGKN